MEREHTKLIRRLATACWHVGRPANSNQPSDADLHGSLAWRRAQAVYRELNKIDEERYAK